MRTLRLCLLLLLTIAGVGCGTPPEAAVSGASGAPVNYLTDFPALNDDGTVNAVIEIPAGTSAKFEVTADGTTMVQDQVDGKPRFIAYLAYPWNYGMVPRTLEDPDLGGDGDPLDILVLGAAVPRGNVVAVRLLGVARTVDTGERDDKLIAVLPDSPLAVAADLDDLEAKFPGVLLIVRTWLTNYKEPGMVVVEGVENGAAARRILDSAADAYARRSGASQ
ncbi:MAG: inorganic diphosphatase [Acidobacteriota bacterium]|jgi:inorganic pyrophosphatase